MDVPEICPYCSIPADDAWIANDLAVAVPHSEPLAQFHFVIAPTRHAPAFYDLDVQEQGAIWGVIRQIEARLREAIEIHGIDIGFQDGASEQDHVLIHVLPRTAGVAVNLPTGIEWVFSP